MMNRLKNALIPILSVLCFLSVIMMIIVLCNGTKKEAEFIPPFFDTTAIQGTPEPAQELGWSEIYQEGMDYSVGISGNIIVYENIAEIYFSNTKSNTVWLKLRMLDEQNNIIGETGLIKPNEYIESIQLNDEVQNGQNVKVKIMAYEPDTYYSAGSIVLNTNIRTGEG